MPLPLALQRSYLGQVNAINDQTRGIARTLVEPGDRPDPNAGPAALQPVNANDQGPTDTVSTDPYTGGEQTKIQPTNIDRPDISAIQRRLGVITGMGNDETSRVQQAAYNSAMAAAGQRMSNAKLGYSLEGSPVSGGGAGISGLDAEGKRGAILRAASKFLGTPYKWGGAAPGGFDCSGLVQYVYGQMGIKTPRVSQQQAQMGQVTKDMAALKPGDFIAWDRGGTGGASHIAIYAGNGQVIEAPHTGANVRYRKINMNEPGIFGVKLGGF